MIMLDLIQPTALCGGSWCGRDKWACTKCQRARVRLPNGSWSETLQKHNRINDWIANL
jgi:transposase-like protein